jgi:hypothetical protein
MCVAVEALLSYDIYLSIALLRRKKLVKRGKLIIALLNGTACKATPS